MNHFDILIPGHYFCDLIFTGLADLPQLGTEIYSQGMQLVPGGGAINTMVALHRLQIKSGWIGVLGSDFASRFIADWLVGEGIKLSLVRRDAEPMRRMTVALSYPHERAFVSYIDPAPDIVALTIETLEQTTCRHLHFPGLLVDPRLPGLLKSLRDRGVSISMDCQHRPETLQTPLVREILSQIDIFMPNASEAMHLTDARSIPEAAAALHEYVPQIVIKDGANGAYCFTMNTMIHAPALSITPVDTTGAGDVFNAGFLAARLAGLDPLTCLRWGNHSGGLSTLGYGGAVSAPTLAAVQSTMNT